MKQKIFLSILAMTLFLCVFPALASALSTITIGEYQITYDEVLEADTDENGVNDRSSYYKEGTLVFTAYDTDENGKPDLWFRYDEDLYLDLEVADKDGDGEPDEFLSVNRNEEVVQVEKDADIPQKDKTTKEGSSALFWIGAIIIIAGGGYWWWSKNKRKK